jgi:mono/diheme cytochrome c family protein
MSALARAIRCAIVSAVAAAAAGVAAQPKSVPIPPAPASAGANEQQIQRGRYLTELGDCVACHTERDGAQFAGGRPLQTPFGTVLSANLTPDADTGIGRYTPETFYRALHEGIDREGRHLYPAFPYNYFARVQREDSDAMFAYLKSLPPVRHAVDRNQLPFPFNIRGLMVLWNALFLDSHPYQDDTTRSAQWNRGAYLARGLGHCGACHTPKNLLGAPKTRQEFEGGRFANLFAPDITSNLRSGIGGWSRPTLIDFLRSGRSTHSDASAEMGEVVAFSTSQMSDGDLDALVTYLTDRAGSQGASPAKPDEQAMHRGRAIFADVCAACHQDGGEGVPRMFPPLKGNANVQQRDPTTVLHFILDGTRAEPTDRAPTPLSMPAFNWKLNDADIAAVATYVRNAWGNTAPEISARQVADLRAKLPHPSGGTDATPAQSMVQPGPGTLAPASTDSRDNGTPRAGRAAPSSEDKTASR